MFRRPLHRLALIDRQWCLSSHRKIRSQNLETSKSQSSRQAPILLVAAHRDALHQSWSALLPIPQVHNDLGLQSLSIETHIVNKLFLLESVFEFLLSP